MSLDQISTTLIGIVKLKSGLAQLFHFPEITQYDTKEKYI